MADHNITINNELRVFAGEPPTCWNAFTWGTGKWGYGTNDMPQYVIKVLENSIAPDTTLGFGVIHLISETLTPTADMVSEGLREPAGYSYVFPGAVTNAENRIQSTYTSGTAGSTTWTQVTASSTSWSSS